ncbi:unnamed protein product [Adineta ricciae]|uniref:G-protein coupled receptors family 1 profile domain-containing protein n=2 Tax=Adineta ricciae TaxID=249248 RepID=A0A815G4L4_ADIRI|nr:unnamed protein product [Adineta ricciae]
MSTNNTTEVIGKKLSIEVLIVSYFSLTLVIIGTSLNSLTFIILCRARFRNTKVRPVLHYMRTIAVFDILMLYGWNFDNYVYPIYGFFLQRTSIGTCKFLSFLNYFASQSSAWFRIFICLDRYLTLSQLHRTWFSYSKHVFIVIASILTFFFLLNLHIIIFACYYNPNGTVNINSSLFTLYPTWNYVKLAFYNLLPLTLMMALNSSVIYHLRMLQRTTTLQNSRIQHRSITITLVSTTVLFFIMTTPAAIGFTFFSDSNRTILRSTDCISYGYHILSFPLYMITFDEFRQEFFAMIMCKRNNQRVAVVKMTTKQVNNTK